MKADLCAEQGGGEERVECGALQIPMGSGEIELFSKLNEQ